MPSNVGKKDSFRQGLMALLFLGLLGSNFVFELGGVLSYSRHLLLRSVLALVIVGLFFQLRKITRQKLQPIIKSGIIILAAALLLNVFLNMINVYSLGENARIVELCSTVRSLCAFIQAVFFKFKLFRFITLSSYFFLLPMLVLVMIYLGNNFVSELKKYDLPRKFFLALIFLLILPNLLKSFHRVYLSIIQGYQIRHENFYDRFVFREGGVSYYGWIRVFSNFILSQTPDDVSLLVPPQALEYKMEGNINYFRWFLYPRKLYHLENLEGGLESSKIDYVVISGGECGSKQCVWPDFAIDQDTIERMIFIDRETQAVTTVENKPFLPDKYQNQWGLIKLQ